MVGKVFIFGVVFLDRGKEVIPKILHYVWVGDSSKPPLVEQCMASWKKFCPTFQIMEWNNQSLATIQNRYVQEACEYKKWAFVSDYLRLYALYHYGGIYLDTDVELTSPLDSFLHLSFMTGFEKWNGQLSPVTAVMGAEANNKIIADLLMEYERLVFVRDGVMDTTTNTVRIRNYFISAFHLHPPYSDCRVELMPGCLIFPSHFFCTPQEGKENFAIHHFNGSWKNGWKKTPLLTLGRYQIIKLSRKGENLGDPLLKEKVLWSIGNGTRRRICLICKERKK